MERKERRARAYFPRKGDLGIVRVDRSDSVLILTKDMRLEVVMPPDRPSCSGGETPRNVLFLRMLFHLMTQDSDFLDLCTQRLQRIQLVRAGVVTPNAGEHADAN